MKKERLSGIELLKIVAMLMIIASHNIPVEHDWSYVFAARNMHQFILVIMAYLGNLGNALFLICSCWWLISDSNVKSNKLWEMWFDLHCVALIILLVLMKGDRLVEHRIIELLFPNIYDFKWYITCYMMLYVMHPLINMIIERLSLKCIIEVNICMVIYSVVVMIFQKGLFYNSLIGFVIVYFAVAFYRKYIYKFINLKKAILMVIIGIVGIILEVGISNLIFLKIPILDVGIIQMWRIFINPFQIMIALGFFFIMYNAKIDSKLINKISKASLLIYMIHQNDAVKEYITDPYWKYMHINCRVSNNWNPLLVVVLSVILFVFSYISAVFYSKTIGKFTHWLAEMSDRLFKIFMKNVTEKVYNVIKDE